MKADTAATEKVTKRDPGTIPDDRYLTEMTDRLRRLRALMGEQETRKGRPMSWTGRFSR